MPTCVAPPALSGVRAQILRRAVRHQSVDACGRAGGHRARQAPVADPDRHLPRARTHGGDRAAGGRAARHGVRGELGARRGRPGLRLALPCAAAPPGVRGVRDVVQGGGLRRPPPGVGVRGRGRPRTGRPLHPGGHGFRTTPAAHREVQEFFGVPTIGLQLVDPYFYHLDTALFVLDETAETDGAPSRTTRRRSRPAAARCCARLFPSAVLATRDDAMAFGLNSVSDGRHVFVAPQATGLIAQLDPRAATSPSPSTSPSSTRPAEASSAAPRRSAHDRSARTARRRAPFVRRS